MPMPQPESYDLTMNPGTPEQRADNIRAMARAGERLRQALIERQPVSDLRDGSGQPLHPEVAEALQGVLRGRL